MSVCRIDHVFCSYHQSNLKPSEYTSELTALIAGDVEIAGETAAAAAAAVGVAFGVRALLRRGEDSTTKDP